MPIYTFECDPDSNGCGCIFEVVKQMDEITDYKPKCPNCNKKKNVIRNYSADNVLTNDGQPKTLGMLAEKNTRTFSKAKKDEINRKNTEYLRNKKGRKLPDGMKYVGRQTSTEQKEKDPKK